MNVQEIIDAVRSGLTWGCLGVLASLAAVCAFVGLQRVWRCLCARLRPVAMAAFSLAAAFAMCEAQKRLLRDGGGGRGATALPVITAEEIAQGWRIWGVDREMQCADWRKAGLWHTDDFIVQLCIPRPPGHPRWQSVVLSVPEVLEVPEVSVEVWRMKADDCPSNRPERIRFASLHLAGPVVTNGTVTLTAIPSCSKWSRFKNHFISVTKQLLSSGQPLPRIDIGAGGN